MRTDSIRPLVLGLGVMATLVRTPSPRAQDAAPPQAESAPSESITEGLGREALGPFVPLKPRTAEDQARIDAARYFAAARAMEDQGEYSEAIRLLERAHQKAPDSVAILRRLSRLCFGTGRTIPAVDYSRRVVEADPADVTTLRRLVTYLVERKGDPAGAEALLKGALANTKLDKASAARVLIWRDLGELYSLHLQRNDEAADAFAKVVEALDDQVASPLSAADQKRVLGDEAESYASFGEVFVQARRHELAIKSFRRGLAYAPDHPRLPLLLAETLLKAGKAAEALEVLDPLLQKKPEDVQAYELLAQVLTALGRADEVLPRLEAAAAADRGNVRLQYALADRYREAGQLAKANARLRAIAAAQPDPQGFGAMAESLRKEKKYDELLRRLEETGSRPSGQPLILPQVEAILNDPAETDAVLAAGLELLKSDPPGLTEAGRRLLVYIAGKGKKPDVLIALDRLALEKDPSPQAYFGLFYTLFQNGKPDEAATVLEEMLAKYPRERNAQRLVGLAQARVMAGRNEDALDAAREALKLEPENLNALRLVGLALTRLGKADEALAHYKGMSERFPNQDEVARVVRFGLSNLYVEMEEFDKGEAELEVLLEKDPEDAGINNDLGYLYADRGKNLDKAEAMIRKALAQEPDNVAYLDSLGWVLFKRGKVKEAVESLEKAVAKDPGYDATIHDHLGDVYARLQDHAKARAAWERAEAIAARSQPPDKRLPEIRRKLEALRAMESAPRPSTVDNP